MRCIPPSAPSCHGVMPHILNKGTRHLWTKNSKRVRQSTHYLFTRTLQDASNSEKMLININIARLYPELMFHTVVNVFYGMKGGKDPCPQEQCLVSSIYTVVYYELSLSPETVSCVQECIMSFLGQLWCCGKHLSLVNYPSKRFIYHTVLKNRSPKRGEPHLYGIWWGYCADLNMTGKEMLGGWLQKWRAAF